MTDRSFATVLENCTLVTIQNQLASHSSDLPTIGNAYLPELQIDLSALVLINSIGVRQFQNWIGGIECDNIKLLYCTPIFVHQLNLVHKFLPSYCKVESFFVPYYSETTMEEKLILYNRNVEFEWGGGELVLNKPFVLDSAGLPMEMDVQSDRYFDFLKEYF